MPTGKSPGNRRKIADPRLIFATGLARAVNNETPWGCWLLWASRCTPVLYYPALGSSREIEAGSKLASSSGEFYARLRNTCAPLCPSARLFVMNHVMLDASCIFPRFSSETAPSLDPKLDRSTLDFNRIIADETSSMNNDVVSENL